MISRADRLQRLCSKLGLLPSQLLEAEGLSRLHLEAERPGSAFAQVTSADLDTLATDFPGVVDFGARDIMPLVVKGRVQEGPDRRLAQIVSLNTCQVWIEIEKAKLARTLTPFKLCHPVFYLFRQKFLRLLSAPLPELDRTLFADRYTPTLIVVSDSPDLLWEGSCVTVVGESALKDSEVRSRLKKRLVASGRPRQQQRLDRCHEAVRSALNWLGFELVNVTPIHFLGGLPADRKAPGVEAAMARQAVHALIIFSASRSHFKSWVDEQGTKRGALGSCFESEDQSVELELGNQSPTVSSTDLARLALWPYQSEGNDRLLVFGKIVARSLEPRLPGEVGANLCNYELFLGKLRQLLQDAVWSYRVLLGRRIEQHFEAVRRAERTAVETARELSVALNSVTQGLSETLLATVGVVVLTLLAAVVKGDADGVIFELGMKVYAGYLVLFQVLYRMVSVWHSYQLTKAEWEDRKRAFHLLLSPRTIKDLTTIVGRRRTQFLVWFWITVALYLGVAAGIWKLPGQVLHLLS